tara:strand:- start:1655 stop:2302 length:648 start_codon:yes stop_codon:yes gene_type:complete
MLVILSTYNPKELNLALKRDNNLFNIKTIEVRNNILIETVEIEEKLINIYNKNIFLLNKKEIESPLKDISFLKKIEVKKKYPSTVIVKVYETAPTAILYKNKKKYLLDSSAKLVLTEDPINFTDLPGVFGEDAENNFLLLFKKLKKNNFPSESIKNYYYYQIGRWDLELLDNKIAKLPNNNLDEAIIKLIELLDRDDFKNYNIIDLRLDGKIIVE